MSVHVIRTFRSHSQFTSELTLDFSGFLCRCTAEYNRWTGRNSGKSALRFFCAVHSVSSRLFRIFVTEHSTDAGERNVSQKRAHCWIHYKKINLGLTFDKLSREQTNIARKHTESHTHTHTHTRARTHACAHTNMRFELTFQNVYQRDAASHAYNVMWRTHTYTHVRTHTHTHTHTHTYTRARIELTFSICVPARCRIARSPCAGRLLLPPAYESCHTYEWVMAHI